MGGTQRGDSVQVLFVHGLGRTPLSGLPTLWRLRRQGHDACSFGYCASLQTFEAIRGRLEERLTRMAGQGDYAVVGHSLGGVLLRSALESLPVAVPRPTQAFLLGSPIAPARMARLLRDRWLFRLLAGDCGQLLASGERMGAIGPMAARTTSIVGIKGWKGAWSPFGGTLNDGVVAVDEVAAPWIAEEIRVPVVHTLLPSSQRVAGILLASMDLQRLPDPLRGEVSARSAGLPPHA